jgi:DNA modification methylase
LEKIQIRPTPGDNAPVACLMWGECALQTLRKLPSSSVHSVVTELPVPGIGENRKASSWPGVSYSPVPGCPQIDIPAQEVPFGDEASVEDFIGHAVLIFQEIQRVLRKDGTLWFHCRDRYAAKQLCLIPQRLALALQAEGWVLRNEVIWQRDNTTPESVRDRLTRTHGTIFFFSHPLSKKKDSWYFYDAEAIREEHTSKDEKHIRGYNKSKSVAEGFARRPDADKAWHPNGRNKRTVWSVNLGAYLGKAVSPWPLEIVEPMVWASVSAAGVCGECGAPLTRVSDKDWQKTCYHSESKVIRPTVLDPFAGTAVTGKVAMDWGADFIGVDIDMGVLPEARARLEGLTHSRKALQNPESPILDFFLGEAK